jgi:hypothetical protein
MESRETEIYSKLYKTGKEQQIFLGFQILKQNIRKQQIKQNLFGFFKYQTETRR